MLSVASAMPALASAGLRSRVAPAVSAPTRLRIPDLLQMTDHGANDFLNGHFDDLLPSGGLPVDERWFTRIYGDDELDLWLSSWVPDESTELHAHGGSLGAVTVISGELLETRWDGWLLRDRRLAAGDQAGFPLGWVHDVVWSSGGGSSAPISPALSVHAYAPPLTAMSYYEVTERNMLRRKRTDLTEQPEG